VTAADGVAATFSLRRQGDATLLLWALAGLAGGVPAVLLGRLSWGAMAGLNAAFAVAAFGLATAVAAVLDRRGRDPLFLAPSVRQACLLLIPLGLLVQAGVIGWRDDSVTDLGDAVDRLKTQVTEMRDPAARDSGEAQLALAETVRTAAQSAPPGEQQELVDLGIAVAETPPGQALPIPDEWKDDAGTGKGLPAASPPAAEDGSQGSQTATAGTGAEPDSPRSLIAILIRILTGPLRGLFEGLLSLGNGGEEYRREATEIVLDLQRGRQPPPATVAALLARLGPADRQKAKALLEKFVAKQPGAAPGPGPLRCTFLRSQTQNSDALDRLAGMLCQNPRTECPEIEKALLIDGVFPTAADKQRALEFLADAGLANRCSSLTLSTGIRQ
jgi:hypothetical protein